MLVGIADIAVITSLRAAGLAWSSRPDIRKRLIGRLASIKRTVLGVPERIVAGQRSNCSLSAVAPSRARAALLEMGRTRSRRAATQRHGSLKSQHDFRIRGEDMNSKIGNFIGASVRRTSLLILLLLGTGMPPALHANSGRHTRLFEPSPCPEELPAGITADCGSSWFRRSAGTTARGAAGLPTR